MERLIFLVEVGRGEADTMKFLPSNSTNLDTMSDNDALYRVVIDEANVSNN